MLHLFIDFVSYIFHQHQLVHPIQADCYKSMFSQENKQLVKVILLRKTFPKQSFKRTCCGCTAVSCNVISKISTKRISIFLLLGSMEKKEMNIFPSVCITMHSRLWKSHTKLNSNTKANIPLKACKLNFKLNLHFLLYFSRVF